MFKKLTQMQVYNQSDFTITVKKYKHFEKTMLVQFLYLIKFPLDNFQYGFQCSLLSCNLRWPNCLYICGSRSNLGRQTWFCHDWDCKLRDSPIQADSIRGLPINGKGKRKKILFEVRYFQIPSNNIATLNWVRKSSTTCLPKVIQQEMQT